MVRKSENKEYIRTLERKVEALRILTEVSSIISSTLDISELMSLVMEKAKEILSADACSILIYNRKTNKLEFEVAICGEEATSEMLKEKITLDMGQGIAGWVAQNQQILVIKDVKKDKRFFHDVDKMTGFETKSLIAAPLIGRRGLIGVAEIINPQKEDYDLEILNILTKHFATAIENAIYHSESLERERIKQELEIAATLQKSFLPENPIFEKGKIKVSAINIPARHVGGDLYDFVEPVKGKVGVFIGDVSGKGVSAALYMAKIISDFRYITRGVNSPSEVMYKLNKVLSGAPRGMFLTAIYLIVDVENGESIISIAGHPPCIMINKDGIKVLEMQAGPPLGIIETDFKDNEIILKNGDKLIMLTDGVFEAKNILGERIGFNTILEFIGKNQNIENLSEKIIGLIDEYSKNAEMADDITIVEIKFQ